MGNIKTKHFLISKPKHFLLENVKMRCFDMFKKFSFTTFLDESIWQTQSASMYKSFSLQNFQLVANCIHHRAGLSFSSFKARDAWSIRGLSIHWTTWRCSYLVNPILPLMLKGLWVFGSSLGVLEVRQRCECPRWEQRHRTPGPQAAAALSAQWGGQTVLPSAWSQALQLTSVHLLVIH